ncbi:GtrA family protein [Sphingomonas sediminicola]|uniref:GtrA family protein n=1 Tax=Sphingomonas sediminicola TaxID=386874 RepID=A0ABX6T9S7_9SPHN|nr:GtrA family protein [Sphingomonas sediminicola]QNP45473.1 GtrA family protein [Sphingomonas sediminicola]
MTLSELLPLDKEHRAVLLQAARYGFAGFVITVLFSISYWAVTDLLGVDPMISLTLVFLVFSGISYFAHGAFSFRGHGSRDQQHIRATRFLLVNIIGFLLNQFFVWMLVKQLGGPTWWPIIPSFSSRHGSPSRCTGDGFTDESARSFNHRARQGRRGGDRPLR